MRKKFLTILMLVVIANFMVTAVAFAQEETAVDPAVTEEVVTDEVAAEEVVEEEPFVESPKAGGVEMFARKIVGSGFVDIFIKGGFTMWPILILLIWGIAIIIWKLVSLNYAKINVTDFLEKLTPLLKEKKYKDAVTLCETTKGPVAAMCHAGLVKHEGGIEAIEKALENAGVIEMAFLEKGFIPISTVINLAPMFGFFGTLIGMIEAFEAIEKAGEVEPTIVAGGIKVALITSAAGLAVAIPVQFFNNMFLGSVDALVMDMQRASEKVIETLVESR